MILTPKISVITVTYNAVDYIEKTLQNVIGQTYPNIEYVIIDGASSDGTLDILERYRQGISTLISEPDKGLYDAMNKAIKTATGDYIIFMNAGDVFYEKETVEKAFANWDGEDFVYGDTLMVDEAGKERPWYKEKPAADKINYRGFINGMVICHQSMFLKRSLARPYRLDLRISADIDWCIRCLKAAKTFKDADIIISKFLDGGVSKTNRKQGWEERFKVLRSHFGLGATLWQHCLIVVKALKRGNLG